MAEVDAEAGDDDVDEAEVVGVTEDVADVEGAAAASGRVSGAAELTVTPTNSPTATNAAPTPIDANRADG